MGSRDRTTLYSQSDDMPLLDAAEKKRIHLWKQSLVKRRSIQVLLLFELRRSYRFASSARLRWCCIRGTMPVGASSIKAYDNLARNEGGRSVPKGSRTVMPTGQKRKNHEVARSDDSSCFGVHLSQRRITMPKGRLVVAWMGRPLGVKRA